MKADESKANRQRLREWIADGWKRQTALAKVCGFSRQYIEQLLTERDRKRPISLTLWSQLLTGMDQVQRSEWNDAKQLKYLIIHNMKRAAATGLNGYSAAALVMTKRLIELEQRPACATCPNVGHKTCCCEVM